MNVARVRFVLIACLAVAVLLVLYGTWGIGGTRGNSVGYEAHVRREHVKPPDSNPRKLPAEELEQVIIIHHGNEGEDAKEPEEKQETTQPDKTQATVSSVEVTPTPTQKPPTNPYSRQSYVFVATNDFPLLGILTVNQGLVNSKTLRQRVILCTPSVGQHFRSVMTLLNITVIDIPDSPSHRNYIPNAGHWKSLLSKLEMIYLIFVSMMNNDECNIRPMAINSGLFSTIPNREWHKRMIGILDTTVIKQGDQEVMEVFFGSQKDFGIQTLPELYAAFVWRCDCFHRGVPYYDITQVKVVHFTNWWLNPRSVATQGVAGRSLPHQCAVPHYAKWKETYDMAAANLKFLAQGAPQGLRQYIQQEIPGAS
ncbi:hypothetical protein Pelo_8262 [Pelomyxa schiedti]|nr:hypothetical protein Pelo_8262 [Pelomyxa schiedti]